MPKILDAFRNYEGTSYCNVPNIYIYIMSDYNCYHEPHNTQTYCRLYSALSPIQGVSRL